MSTKSPTIVYKAHRKSVKEGLCESLGELIKKRPTEHVMTTLKQRAITGPNACGYVPRAGH